MTVTTKHLAQEQGWDQNTGLTLPPCCSFHCSPVVEGGPGGSSTGEGWSAGWGTVMVHEGPWGECCDEVEDLGYWVVWEKVGCVGGSTSVPFRVGCTAHLRLWLSEHDYVPFPLTSVQARCVCPVLVPHSSHDTHAYAHIHTDTVALGITSKS